jgi:hypothetical protein
MMQSRDEISYAGKWYAIPGVPPGESLHDYISRLLPHGSAWSWLDALDNETPVKLLLGPGVPLVLYEEGAG